MYCKNCGAQIDDGDRFCSYCGARVKSNDYEGKSDYDNYEGYSHVSESECNDHYVGEEKTGCPCDDKPSVGYGILSFFIPLVGLILFISWHKETPKKAKSCIIGAIIGFALALITNSFMFELMFAFFEEFFMYM